MKLTIQSENLSLALSAVNKSTSSRTSLPILKNVLLKAEKSKLYLTTTDLESSIKAELTADVEIPGSTTVLAKTIFEYVNSLPSCILTLELVNNNLEISTQGNRAKLLVIPSEEFPAVPSSEGEPLIRIPMQEFVSSLDKVVFAASLDESRQVITGILFEIADKVLNIVGVDGYRLSKKSLNVGSEKNVNIIIPSKSLAEMTRIVNENKAEENGEVKIYLFPDGNNISFVYGGIELITRLIEGEFPDYKRIIPTQFTTEVSIITKDFSNALKTINVFTKASSSSRIGMKFIPEESKVILNTSLPQIGENISELESRIEGKEGEVFFNIRYLSDLLNHIKSDTLLFKASVDKNFPCLVKEIVDEKEDETFLHMIMPMSIK